MVPVLPESIFDLFLPRAGAMAPVLRLVPVDDTALSEEDLLHDVAQYIRRRVGAHRDSPIARELRHTADRLDLAAQATAAR